jgi:uncharacterized protein
MTYHPPDYLELLVTDVARAKAFYAAAFGWEFNDYGPDYAGIRSAAGDSEVGGLARGEAVPGRGPVLPLVRSADLDSSLADVLAAGGTVVEEPFAFPGGRRFSCADPDGIVVGVYEPAGSGEEGE